MKIFHLTYQRKCKKMGRRWEKDGEEGRKWGRENDGEKIHANGLKTHPKPKILARLMLVYNVYSLCCFTACHRRMNSVYFECREAFVSLITYHRIRPHCLHRARCEATLFAVAATNRNEVGRALYCQVGRSRGEAVRTSQGTRCRWSEMRWDEMRWDEMKWNDWCERSSTRCRPQRRLSALSSLRSTSNQIEWPLLHLIEIFKLSETVLNCMDSTDNDNLYFTTYG